MSVNYTRKRHHRHKRPQQDLFGELIQEIRSLRHRLHKKWVQWLTPSKNRLIKICVIVCIIGLPPFDAFIYEPRHIELTTYDVPVKNLPRALDGLRVVQISDTHHGTTTPDSIIAKAVKIVNSTHPDIVVLTGDFVTYNELNPAPLSNTLGNLHPRIGSYAVLGNHDHDAGVESVIRSLELCGIHVLINSNAQPAKGFYIVGLDDLGRGKPDPKAAFEGMGKNASYITLAHSPDASRLLQDRYGLLLTGHTHGGQIRFPFVSQYALPGLVDNKYRAGWYLENELLIYVNRGIGMTNIPARFLCRPEVTLFVLRTDYTEQHRR